MAALAVRRPSQGKQAQHGFFSKKMSWQTYVDSNLVGSGHVSKAAIIGLDGSVWAKTAGWNIEADAPAIANAMKQPADSLFGTGISFEKEKYFAIYSQDGTFYGKKGPNGLSLAKSTQCITVGWHQENINPANCRMTVEGIRDYLQSTGY